MEVTPSFALIVIEQDFCTRLQIPEAFIEEFGRHLPKKVLLKDSFGKSWEVDVEKIDKVTVYGSTMCANKVCRVATGWSSEPLVGERTERNIRNQRETKRVEVDDGIQAMEERPEFDGSFKKGGATGNKDKIHEIKVKEEEVIYCDSDSSPSDQTGSLKQSAQKRRKNAYMSEDSAPPRKRGNTTALSPTDRAKEFKSKYPCFQVELTQSYVRSYLSIPITFSKEHLKGQDQDIKLKILKKFWDAKISFNKSRKDARLIGGWGKFSRENGLKVGNVCVFEMVRSDDIVFNVHIYRC